MASRQERHLDKLKADLRLMLEEKEKLEREIHINKIKVDDKREIIKQYEEENALLRNIIQKTDQKNRGALEKEIDTQQGIKSTSEDLMTGMKEGLELDSEIHFLKTKLDTLLVEGHKTTLPERNEQGIAKNSSTERKPLSEHVERENIDVIRTKRYPRFSLDERPGSGALTAKRPSRRFSKF